jgi:glutathione S-transferase
VILYLGSKNYSSWSLRAWLALKHTGLPFEEVVIPLDQPTSKSEIARHSPSGRVPALADGDFVVWDSLAICEYLAERYPPLWPEERAVRALARSVSCEMHSGFQALRQHLPMNARRSSPGVQRTDEVNADIARISAIWRQCREAHGAGGPFLFGRFSIADCMYAPVVSRFATYGVDTDEVGRAYSAAIWAMPAMQAWITAARAEPHTSPKYDR